MNLFELFVKIGVKDEASKNIEGISSKLGKGLTTAAKIGTAAIGAAAGAVVALTKQAVESYAEYEQLVGGIETLYGNAGQSMEDYVKDVAEQTKKRGFEPDLEAIAERWKALEAVEQKVLSNASVAYKTAGLSANKYMETITGFTAALNQSIDDTSVVADYADMAVRDMSDNANKMGTNMEMIQNAYQGFAKQNYTMLDNLKLGYGGTKGEMERLLVDANRLDSSLGLVNEEGKLTAYTFADIVKAINVVQTDMGITGTTAKEAGATISGSVNSMKAAWSNLVTGIADKNADLEQLIDNLVTSVVGDGTESNLGVIGNILPAVEKALDGAADLVDRMFPIIIDKIPEFIIKFLPKLAKSAVKIIETLVNSLSENSDELTEVALEVIITLAEGLVKFLPKLIEKAPDIIFGIVNTLVDYLPEIISVGGDIVSGIWQGIKNAGGRFKENVKSFFSDIVNSVKETLGIHSPSKVFAEIGGYMAEGVGEGWDDEFGNIKRDINNSLDFGGDYIGTFGGGYDNSYIGSGSVGRPINITQNIYAQKKSAAQLMQEARWQAQMGVLASV